jgi:hypothetical protein
VITSIAEHFADDTSGFTDIFINDGGRYDFEEVGLEGGCYCSGEKRFAGPRGAV